MKKGDGEREKRKGQGGGRVRRQTTLFGNPFEQVIFVCFLRKKVRNSEKYKGKQKEKKRKGVHFENCPFQAHI